jgi:hypothetical protein
MKSFKSILLPAMALAFVFAGCNKTSNPNPADPRDNITGARTVSDSTFIQFSKSVPPIGLKDTLITSTALLTMISDPGNSAQVDIKDLSGTGLLQYVANGAATVSGGTGFNIPSQTVTDTTGNTWTFSGATAKIVGQQSFSGFMSSANKITIIYSGTLSGKLSGIPYTVPFKRVSGN